MTIEFEKIVPTDIQIEKLYLLLKNRSYMISHKFLPSFEEHKSFVSNYPYIAWYLLYKNKSALGSFYIHTDNSVGINLIEKYEENDVCNIIGYIQKNYSPLPPIKSVRRGVFFMNVASENTELIKVLQNLGKTEFQSSFLV